MSNDEKCPDLSQWVLQSEARHAEIIVELRRIGQQKQPDKEPENIGFWVIIVVILSLVIPAILSNIHS